MKLTELIPAADDLLSLEPEELAGCLIEYINALPTGDRGNLNRGNFSDRRLVAGYEEGKQPACQRALMEAWAVLEREGLLAHRPEDHHGWYFVTRRGATMTRHQDFESFRKAQLFPKDSIHPALRNTYSLFLRGDYETAIFEAFKTVEVAVRDACSQEFDSLYGVELMRKAFNVESGPLTEKNEPNAEREALLHLFSGAIGRFKNPASHRRVPLTSPDETIEMLQFASHLLRVVDDRAS